jgi:pimeloyl-ACP methyl ester carboxylesterase
MNTSAATTTQPGATGSTVAVGEIVTHYHDVGAGAPLLMLHGSGPGVSAMANWRHTMGPLAEHFRVLAPDMVGFGYTSRPDGIVYGPDTWLAHVVGFLDALGIERAHVIGNSLGARIALGLALQHPDRVARLVLMGAGVLRRETSPALAVTRSYEPTPEFMRRVLEGFAYDPAIVTDAMVEERYRASVEPGAYEAYAQMFRDAQHAGNATTLPDEALQQVRAETLIVHGFDDKVIPYELSVRMLTLIPDSRLYVLRQCGHWAQLEHADAFNRLAIGFLDA